VDSRFGNPDDWGLSPARHSEIASELGDHLDCLQADEGRGRAHEAEARLATAKVRRKLSSAHIADQVVATLHRKPNRREWRELGWLMFWFAIVLCGDAIAGYCAELAHASSALRWQAGAKAPEFTPLALAAWLLLGLSRAMFFYILGRGVLDAWKRGWGVFMARLLQYKLIHTVMVLGGVLILERFVSNRTGWGMLGIMDGVPPLLTSACAFVLLAMFTAGCLVPKLRQSGAPVICLLLLLFLYPTGPASGRRVDVAMPFPGMQISEDANYRYYGAETDPAEIRRKMASHVRTNGSLPDGWSLEHRVFEHQTYEFAGPWLNANLSSMDHMYGRTDYSGSYKPVKRVDETRQYGPLFASSPAVHAGCGLGWIAAPVPLMGILGLLSMLFIMGRRGVLPMLLYSLITILALYCSVIPFILTQKFENILELSSQAFSRGPLPGFEQLLEFRGDMGGFMIMGALLLSAGVPWLLTGLFLRGEAGNPLPVDDDADLAMG
jgi:hypothetical protein